MEKMTPSSGNVFEDLGFGKKDAAVMQMRVKLLAALAKDLQGRKKTQAEIARQLNVPQSRISDVMRGNVKRFSIEKIIEMLSSAGRKVEFRIR